MSRLELLTTLEKGKLRKVKARMVREALRTGACDRGNHAVIVSDLNIRFFYRGVAMARISIDTLAIDYPLVGEYERTASTSYHRKTIGEAIVEIKQLLKKETIAEIQNVLEREA